MNNASSLFLVIALTFAPIAGLMAFFITFDEYQHHYNDNKRPFKAGLQAGLFAFIFFMVIAFFAGYVFTNFIGK